ncbi:ATP-dependent Clp protease ATP-binding subunit [bacterium]|nr:ATP-dependent Clp protease ATP-binding subunit [bacterium]
MMFSRFTEKAIQTIMLAQEEAKKFHHSYVGTEHILLGIFNEGDNLVITILVDLGFNIDQVKNAVEEKLEYGGLTSEYGNIPFTQQAKQVLSSAWDEARKLGHNYVNVEHLFLSVFRDPASIAARVLSEVGINLGDFKEKLFKSLGNKVTAKERPQNAVPTPTLDLYGRDLTWLARDQKLDPVVGRSKEIERIIQILSRRTKNNPVLTGEPGVGKTAIVEGLAQKIINDDVPSKLLDKRVITLDLGLLVAGTKYRGEFEDRVKKVMEEVRKAKNIILFIDELHTIIGTGGSEGSLDAANLFKPALARGELQCIGATTIDEYRKHIEGDGALERRFQSLHVDEPSKEEALQILKGIKERYEDFHQVTITEDALEAAVELASRYITERFLPDKAVDLIDEAAAKVMLTATSISKELKELVDERDEKEKELRTANLSNDKEQIDVLTSRLKTVGSLINEFPESEIKKSSKIVNDDTIRDVVSVWTGIPVTKMSSEETARLLKMEEELKERVVGQDDAIVALCRAVKRSKVGLKDPNRPTGSFLFLGPSGVGKTELAKTLADYLFGTPDAMIRVDMSEYMEKHTVSRLIGSPPGYVGYNEGGQLTESVKRKPYSVVLFDELEKASPDIINILLQILEDGRLTDANGKTINFKNTIIIMTSNVGSKFIQKETSFGFKKSEVSQVEADFSSLKQKLGDELRQAFRPEFLNRIDDTVIFKMLTKEHIKKILGIMLKDVLKRITEKGINVSITEKVKEFLVEKGFNQRQGARPLRRSIQEHFEDKLADKLLEIGLLTDVSVKADIKDGAVVFTSRKKPAKKKVVKKKSEVVEA